MRFTQEKKETICSYIMEKIEEGRENVPVLVADAFNINLNTVHTYIRELIDQGKIIREKRGSYSLCKSTHDFMFSRSKGDLDDDLYIYEEAIVPLLSDLDTEIKLIWDYAFSEMINNVMDHSGAEHTWVTVIQDPKATTVVIRDDGIGIFRNVRENLNLRNNSEVITELLKGKLTTDRKKHSGEGIFFTSRMMDRFFIYSDKTFYAIDKFQNEWLTMIPDDESFSGTLVCMSLENDSRKTAKGVFDQYTNDDGEFDRTEIQLSTIFDRAPVSRSQAKRLCSRLNEFREVVLDFSGIGFAHQIFVVFQRDNPEIRMIPRNMTNGVLSMWKHVTG